jgi:hypothetical protein
MKLNYFREVWHRKNYSIFEINEFNYYTLTTLIVLSAFEFPFVSGNIDFTLDVLSLSIIKKISYERQSSLCFKWGKWSVNKFWCYITYVVLRKHRLWINNLSTVTLITIPTFLAIDDSSVILQTEKYHLLFNRT